MYLGPDTGNRPVLVAAAGINTTLTAILRAVTTLQYCRRVRKIITDERLGPPKSG
jgi:hypothetical protein